MHVVYLCFSQKFHMVQQYLSSQRSPLSRIHQKGMKITGTDRCIPDTLDELSQWLSDQKLCRWKHRPELDSHKWTFQTIIPKVWQEQIARSSFIKSIHVTRFFTSSYYHHCLVELPHFSVYRCSGGDCWFVCGMCTWQNFDGSWYFPPIIGSSLSHHVSEVEPPTTRTLGAAHIVLWLPPHHPMSSTLVLKIKGHDSCALVYTCMLIYNIL